MKHSLIGLLLAGALTACDDGRPTTSEPINTRVRLTDAPFPFDLVSRVDVHIVSVDAAESADTGAGVTVVNIATPNAAFNLLELQRGVTAIIGEGAIPAGQYAAVRLVIDTERSSITYANGTKAFVQWPVRGQLALHALVEEALAIFAPGTETSIVIDFDVGRSFYYLDAGADTLSGIPGSGYFIFMPVIRAVNEAGTGGITGTVMADLDGNGQVEPVSQASVSVFRGDHAAGPLTWGTVATGRTDAAGTFVIEFLMPGTYIVSVAPPSTAGAGTANIGGVQVVTGGRTGVNVRLPDADPAALEIVGPSIVQIGHEIILRAVVLDAEGDTLAGQPVSWLADSTNRVQLYDPRDGSAPLGEFLGVRGLAAGVVRIAANSLGLFAQTTIQVSDPNAALVATVELSPATQTVSVFDSLAISAVIKDAQGNVLTDRMITWAVSDTSVLHLGFAMGTTAHFTAKKAGTATVTATSEEKQGAATVTVNQ